MYVKRKGSLECNAQALLKGHEFDSDSYLIVKVEKVIYIYLDWWLTELNNILKKCPESFN